LEHEVSLNTLYQTELLCLFAHTERLERARIGRDIIETALQALITQSAFRSLAVREAEVKAASDLYYRELNDSLLDSCKRFLKDIATQIPMLQHDVSVLEAAVNTPARGVSFSPVDKLGGTLHGLSRKLSSKATISDTSMPIGQGTDLESKQRVGSQPASGGMRITNESQHTNTLKALLADISAALIRVQALQLALQSRLLLDPQRIDVMKQADKQSTLLLPSAL